MKTLFLTAVIAFGALSIQAQNTCETPELKAGDILKIASPSNAAYEHINLPRANFIIKRGGIANYKSLINKEIEVTEVKLVEGCISKVDVKLADGKKFFNTVSIVSIDLKEALASGEVTLK